MIFFLAAAVLILIFFITRAVRSKGSLKARSAILTAGFSLAVTALVLPYFMEKENGIIYALFKSIRYGVSSIAMGADSQVTEAMNDGTIAGAVSASLLYLLYIAGPVTASVFLISFSRNVIERLRQCASKKEHVFSCLNEKTAIIAESIHASSPRDMITFADTPADQDNDLFTRITRIGSFLQKGGIDKKTLRRNMRYVFYVINDDADKNLSTLSSLCSSLTANKRYEKRNVTVRYLASRNSLDLIRDIDSRFGEKVDLRPLDENASLAVELLRENANVLTGKEHKEIMIIGAGSLGLEILRSAVPLMIEPGSHFTVHVIDRDIRSIASRLKASCPELLNLPLDRYFLNDHDPLRNYDIVFYDADVTGSGLEDITEAVKSPDLITVALKNDEMNYMTAMRLMRIYGGRNSGMEYPGMAVRIRSDALRSSLRERDGISFFGDIDEVFDIGRLTHPELEDAAKRVHMTYLAGSYEGIKEKTPEEQEKILEDTGFYSYVNFDSSLNEALAMEFKLAYIRHVLNDGNAGKEAISRWLENSDNIRLMGDCEHLRWNAYQRTMGWRRMEKEQEEAAAFISGGRRVKNDDMLLHPALVSVEELPEAEALADSILRNYREDAASRYVDLDRDIVRELPYILDIK